MSIDPYLTPSAQPGRISGYQSSAVSEAALAHLAGTKPWVRLISVVMFIGAAFILIIAIVFAVAGTAIMANAKLGAYGAGVTAGIGIAYGIFALLYIYPALKLWKYASRIGDLLHTRDPLALEMALNEQRSFWKFVGVLVLVMLVLYAVIIVLGVMMPLVFAGLKSTP